MAGKKAVRAIISGRVQGVNFRMETSLAADRYGVCGWVRNVPDGTVEAYIEGDPENVDAMLDWCRKGPPSASVTDVKVQEEEYTGRYTDFSIRYS
ncbi:MAG: acylphosphatase [Desulfobacteraceae bacterium]|nr:acylphosphatase [Desulfobacteraceae bacterium]